MKIVSVKIPEEMDNKINQFLENNQLSKSDGLRKLVSNGLETHEVKTEENLNFDINSNPNPEMDNIEENKGDFVDMNEQTIRNVIRDELDRGKPTETISEHIRNCPECQAIIKNQVLECKEGICQIVDKRLLDLEVVDEEDLENENSDEEPSILDELFG